LSFTTFGQEKSVGRAYSTTLPSPRVDDPTEGLPITGVLCC